MIYDRPPAIGHRRPEGTRMTGIRCNRGYRTTGIFLGSCRSSGDWSTLERNRNYGVGRCIGTDIQITEFIELT